MSKLKRPEMVIQRDISQSAQYQKHGYLVIENLLPREHVQALGARMQEIVDGRGASFPAGDIEWEPDAAGDCPPAMRKINRCAENDSLFLRHAKDERILDVVEALIGPDIKLYTSQCFLKPPGGVEKPYHQDSAYFAIEPMELVTCWTALDDVTIDNGGMRVIPGSHHRGLLDHSQAWQVGDRQDKQVPNDLCDLDREMPIIMPAGGCSFHHSLLLHRSTPNHTDRPRRGLAVHYMSARSRWTNSDQRQPVYPLFRGREYSGCV